MTKIKIYQISSRNPAENDIKGIAEVFKKCWSSQKNSPPSYLKKVILQEMKSGHRYIVARAQNKIVGFTSWRTWGEPRHRLVELYHIGVLPESAGQGIGSLLVNELIKKANKHYQRLGYPGIRKLFLLNHANNIPPQKFYKKMGFKKVAKIPNFFHKNIDEFVFVKDFE